MTRPTNGTAEYVVGVSEVVVAAAIGCSDRPAPRRPLTTAATARWQQGCAAARGAYFFFSFWIFWIIFVVEWAFLSPTNTALMSSAFSVSFSGRVFSV